MDHCCTTIFGIHAFVQHNVFAARGLATIKARSREVRMPKIVEILHEAGVSSTDTVMPSGKAISRMDRPVLRHP
jgi:hypothetical protein